MDEVSAKMFETYETWKATRRAVDELMEERRQGLPVQEDLIAAIETMRAAWSEFERASAPALHLGRS